ncbi:hypothetical protein HK101_003615, partial [Irineochytrium annulatum]
MQMSAFPLEVNLQVSTWDRHDTNIKVEHSNSVDTLSNRPVTAMLDVTSSPDTMKTESMDCETTSSLNLPAKQESQMSIFNEDDFIMSSKSSSASSLSVSSASATACLDAAVKSSSPVDSLPSAAAPAKKKRIRKSKAGSQPGAETQPGAAGPSTALTTALDDKPVKVRRLRPPNAGPLKPRKSRAKVMVPALNASVGPDGLALVNGHQVIAPFTFSHDLAPFPPPPSTDGLHVAVQRVLHPIRSAVHHAGRAYVPGATAPTTADHFLFKIGLDELLSDCDLVVAETDREVLEVQPASRDMVVGPGATGDFPRHANVVGNKEAVKRRVLPGGIVEDVTDGMEAEAFEGKSRKRVREEDGLEVEDQKRRMTIHGMQSVNDIFECIFGIEVSDHFGVYGKTIPTPPTSSKPAPRSWNNDSPIILHRRKPRKTICTQTEGKMLKLNSPTLSATSLSSNAGQDLRINNDISRSSAAGPALSPTDRFLTPTS